jgi:hypothetical protein
LTWQSNSVIGEPQGLSEKTDEKIYKKFVPREFVPRKFVPRDVISFLGITFCS